jgi:predicted nucleic acid-binding protein
VIYLLDVNALLALAHTAHTLHGRMEAWAKTLRSPDRCATCAITELGFVRIAPQTRLCPDVARARELLARLKRSKRPAFILLPDALGADALPAWATTPGQTTDGHLLALAGAHGAGLATLDAGIPGAVLIA